MIVTKYRQLYYKQKGNGIGFVNKDIHGEGIFTDAMRMLGKKIWVAGKTLFKNQILPNLKVSALHGLKSGKQLIEDNKKEIARVISDQSKNLLKSMLNRSGNTEPGVGNISSLNKVVSDTKNELNNIINKNRDIVHQSSKEILNKLLYGEGFKTIRNRKRKNFLPY